MMLDNLNIYRTKAGQANTYLIVLFAFFLPVSTSITTIAALLIILLWVIEGDLRFKIKEIFTNRAAVAVLVYIAIHIIGLLWTENLTWGLHILQKQWKLLMLPIFLTAVRKEHYGYYINAFVVSMILLVGLSYLIWAEVISFANVLPNDPTPFISRVEYNPFLAFTIYLLLHTIFFTTSNKHWKILLSALVVIMIVNMFITQGRTGQIAFFILMVLFLLQYFSRNLMKGLFLAGIILPLTFTAAYTMIPTFKTRLNETIVNATNFHDKTTTSMGERLTFLENTLEVIENHPLIGTGTGDFPDEYNKVNAKKSPNFKDTVDPHNQYLLAMSQFGISGLVALLAIFFFQFKFLLRQQDNFKRMRIALLVFYLTIMLGGSYLMHHKATFLFTLFSSFLYKLETPHA